jgi:hypothetical protein
MGESGRKSSQRRRPLLDTIRKEFGTKGRTFERARSFTVTPHASIPARGYDFQVFSVDLRCVTGSLIVSGPQGDEFLPQFRLCIGFERSKRARHWTVVAPEKLDDSFRREGIAEAILTPGKLEIGNTVPETFAHDGGISPKHRGGHTGRSNVFRDGFEHLTDEALRRPICHCNDSSRSANARQFRRNQVGAWREHCSDQADDSVKFAVSVWKGFCVSFFKCDLETFGLRTLTSSSQPVRRNIAARHVRATSCSNER